MSPMKHLFKRMIQRFKVEGTEEKEKKFLIVLWSRKGEGVYQLEEQGYMVSYVDNKCRIKYMFDEMPQAVELETTIEGEDEDSIIKSHNSFLSLMAILDLWI
ncbi:hypothetical protein Tco_1347053 [Tanacetum coccineum]